MNFYNLILACRKLMSVSIQFKIKTLNITSAILHLWSAARASAREPERDERRVDL